jgi:Clathrin adaptor complex small chain
MATDMTGELMDHHHGSSSNATTICGWGFIVLMSRQGKIRLSEFFASYTESEKRRILRDIAAEILPRAPKMCNIIEQGSYKFVYRRYASLYFVVGVPHGMNELIVLEQIHLFVEALDGYFNSGTCVCVYGTVTCSFCNEHTCSFCNGQQKQLLIDIDPCRCSYFSFFTNQFVN